MPGAGDGFVGVFVKPVLLPSVSSMALGGAGCPPVPEKGDTREVTCSVCLWWPACSSGSCSNLLRPCGLLTAVLE